MHSIALRRLAASALAAGFISLLCTFVPTAVALAQDESEARYPIVEIEPSRDTTLRAADPSENDGTHRVLHVGSDLQGHAQRVLIAVDPLDAIPPGSQIISARLVFSVDDVAQPDSSMVTLHRVRCDWAEDGATWSHAWFDGQPWDTPGGDVLPYPSGGVIVEGVGRYAFGGGNLVADLQSMLDDPASNHGWLMVGNENEPDQWKQFGSGDNSSPRSRPRWIIEYSPHVEIETISTGALKARTLPR